MPSIGRPTMFHTRQSCTDYQTSTQTHATEGVKLAWARTQNISPRHNANILSQHTARTGQVSGINTINTISDGSGVYSRIEVYDVSSLRSVVEICGLLFTMASKGYTGMDSSFFQPES
ncbi:hypothetical protein BELL_0187g00020 [Botrytis elliptica]|uniref:Uncharacterized protein n=1 Tax=Botrytis elliptica TaxID=278938 RepID=A0A4Z1JQ06_9HELO|nr:hypothetical protein BELL_0187g00020 [Botrytis elliptica]